MKLLVGGGRWAADRGAMGGQGRVVDLAPQLPDRWPISIRSIERRTKAFIIGALGRVLRVRGRPEAPDWPSRPHRVLYLRYDRIGDMVLATGIIKAIVAAHGTITVDVLASRANAAVLRGNPNVGTVMTVDRRRLWSYLPALWRIRRARYDAVIDAMVMAPSLTTMLLMWASAARHRIGVADRGNDFALTLPVPPVQGAVHYVDHSAAILSAFGTDPLAVRRAGTAANAVVAPTDGALPQSARPDWGIWCPEIFLTADEVAAAERRWVAAIGEAGVGAGSSIRLIANVSAGADWRYWPDEHFIATLSRLRARHPSLVALVVGAPDDEARMRRIAGASQAAVATTASYRDMMALVARSDVALTADTSVTHIASAFRTPVVAMFGRGRAGLYGPYGTAGRIVSTPGPSLAALDVEPVVEALEAVIGGRPTDPAARAHR